MRKQKKPFSDSVSIPNFDEGPALRTFAMPADANPTGDIFGGWVMSQMDLAGSAPAIRLAKGRVVTVGVEAMYFHRPIKVGDEVAFYARVVHIGRTSIGVHIDTWARRVSGEVVHVTEGIYTYVAVNQKGRPRPLLNRKKKISK